MMNNLLKMDRTELRERLSVVKQHGLEKIGRDKDGFITLRNDQSNPYHTVLLALTDTYNQTLSSVEHHLGWADKFEEREYQTNTVQAAVDLVLLEELSVQLMVLTYQRPVSII